MRWIENALGNGKYTHDLKCWTVVNMKSKRQILDYFDVMFKLLTEWRNEDNLDSFQAAKIFPQKLAAKYFFVQLAKSASKYDGHETFLYPFRYFKRLVRFRGTHGTQLKRPLPQVFASTNSSTAFIVLRSRKIGRCLDEDEGRGKATGEVLATKLPMDCKKKATTYLLSFRHFLQIKLSKRREKCERLYKNQANFDVLGAHDHADDTRSEDFTY